MKRYMILGVAGLTLVAAGSLVAQETPAPERPQARQRLHAPGTGLMPGETPLRRQLGRMGEEGVADVAYAPRALIRRRTFLGLSDQQVADLERLESQVQTARDKALADAATHREALTQAWNADKPDAKAVRDHAAALMQAHQAAQLEALGVAAQAKAMLSPEQLGKVRGLQEGSRARMGARGRVGVGRGMRAMPRSPRPARPGMRQRFRRPEVM